MKVLVANRGEIAVRILRACYELGFDSVAVYTDVDEVGLHVRYANEAVAIGATGNYLNIAAILEAAHRSGAEAIHPGYGFLAENPAFAQAVEEDGMTFIGPRPETIALTGDKLAARQAARQAGLPILAGSESPLPLELSAEMAAQMNYPLLVKASAGGGGRGIRLAQSSKELGEMVAAARHEALATFGNDSIYLEELVQPARHIEVQILGDGLGGLLCLGERECSIQRRRQKLIEESPAHGLDPELRTAIQEAALCLGKSLNYRSLGTIEFLLDSNHNFYFIEVNPRIQVEHPVTEMVTGIDLVKEQLILAAEGKLAVAQEEIHSHGAAIEARILAEDTEAGFLPVTGEITHLKEPSGPGVRFDSALYPGLPVTTHYDSLLAKVITWDRHRPGAIVRLSRSLNELKIGGVPTDVPFLLQIIESPSFISGKVDTTYLEHFTPPQEASEPDLERELALATALYVHQQRQKSERNPAISSVQPSTLRPAPCADPWQVIAWREQFRGDVR